jgi:hypothetical protein
MRKLISLSALLALTAAVALPAFADAPATTTTGTTTAATTTTTTTTPTAPAPTPRSHSHWFAGSVTAVGGSSVTLGVLWTGPHDGSLDGQSVTVAVDSNTQITSGPKRSPAQLSDIQNGDLIGVRATGLGTDLTTLTATEIHISCNCHWVSGTISSLAGGSITLQVKRTGPYDTVLAGGPVTIGVDDSTVYIQGKDKTPISFSDLEVGDGVGIVFSANGFFKAPGFDPSTAVFTAKRVHQWGHKQVPPPSSDGASAATTSA